LLVEHGGTARVGGGDRRRPHADDDGHGTAADCLISQPRGDDRIPSPGILSVETERGESDEHTDGADTHVRPRVSSRERLARLDASRNFSVVTAAARLTHLSAGVAFS
jgi:hypothetical protein